MESVSATKKSSVELQKSRHTLLEEGIILMEVQEGVFFELEDAENSHRAHLELSGGKSFSILLDTSAGFFTVSPEAKRRIASAEYAKVMKASAFVVNSLPAFLAGNFYLKIIKPNAPTRLFRCKQEALNWLRTF